MRSHGFFAALFLLPAAFAQADAQIDRISVSVADQSWTRDYLYQGDVTVLEVQGHYYTAKFDASGQWGRQGNESLYLRVSPISFERVRELSENAVIKTGVELGDMQLSRDLPLGERNYLEVEPAKIYGTIGYVPKFNSDLVLLASASLAVGYAHAAAVDTSVADTSSLFLGKAWQVQLSHVKLGRLTFSRWVDGESKKYDASRTGSREASVSLKYDHPVGELGDLAFTGEKRSFSMGGATEVGPHYNKFRQFSLTYERGIRR